MTEATVNQLVSLILPHVLSIRKRLADVDQQLEQPELQKNQARFSTLLQERSRLSKIVALYDAMMALQRELQELEAMQHSETDAALLGLIVQEQADLKTQLESKQHALMVALLPPDPSDSRNTILEIRAGIGGDEAALFVADLYRMYMRLAEQQHWSTELLSSHLSETGGFKEIIFLIRGDQVYKKLKYESGGHRVQRVPITEANGRIHTSSATVAVLPEAQEVDIEIRPEELEITVCRASGAGGQYVNKTDSAVQILHKPTGLIVNCANERSQQKNRMQAMKVLRSRLLKQKQDEATQQYANERKQQIGSGKRSDRIRTYNFLQNRVTDHRINRTAYNLQQVLDGDLMDFMVALQRSDEENQLAQFLQDPGASNDNK